VAKLSTPFRLPKVSLHRKARPPSPILAATMMASLSPTTLADFCNQSETRAHRANSKTSLGTGFRLSQCSTSTPDEL
jgi:hypothetical protein